MINRDTWNVEQIINIYTVGNMQAEANELIKCSGLDMLAVPDFDTAAKTVSPFPILLLNILIIILGGWKS